MGKIKKCFCDHLNKFVSTCLQLLFSRMKVHFEKHLACWMMDCLPAADTVTITQKSQWTVNGIVWPQDARKKHKKTRLSKRFRFWLLCDFYTCLLFVVRKNCIEFLCTIFTVFLHFEQWTPHGKLMMVYDFWITLRTTWSISLMLDRAVSVAHFCFYNKYIELINI